jgi:drug/metabolite transporter (DMT)-like permease
LGAGVMKKHVKADLMLIMITVFWGGSYILTKLGLDSLQPFNLIAIRFIIAFLISGIVFKNRIMKSDRRTIIYALILGLILFSVFISMTFGLKYTSASNAGFLISLSVILIPIISLMFLKQYIGRKVIICVLFALVGIGMLTLNTQLKVSRGDLLCILCAVLYAIHVVVTGVFTKEVDSISLGILQLGFVGIFSIIFSGLTEEVKVPNSWFSWLVVLALSILCTAVGYIVQTHIQQYTSATHTGLILSLEPVFSAIFAYLILGEVLSVRGYIGASILLVSVFFAEFNFKWIRHKSTMDIQSN